MKTDQKVIAVTTDLVMQAGQITSAGFVFYVSGNFIIIFN